MTEKKTPPHDYWPQRKAYWRTNNKSGQRELVGPSGPCRVCGTRHITEKLAEIRDKQS